MSSIKAAKTGAIGSGSKKRLSKQYKRVATEAKAADLKPSYTARFSEMVLINFEADERLLKKITPKGLEPDLYQGSAHISLVAKTVRGLRTRGLPVSRPFGSIGLQLYVKELHEGEYRYGTVFLKHYVQRSIAAWMMSRLTHTEVTKLPMEHQSDKQPSNRPPEIEYRWKVGEKWNNIHIRGRSRVKDIRPGGKIDYILRHADRYVVNKDGVWRSQLNTPGWVIWDVAQAKFDCDVKKLFGQEFSKAMSRRPASVFLSRGNEVAITKPELVVPVAK